MRRIFVRDARYNRDAAQLTCVKLTWHDVSVHAPISIKTQCSPGTSPAGSWTDHASSQHAIADVRGFRAYLVVRELRLDRDDSVLERATDADTVEDLESCEMSARAPRSHVTGHTNQLGMRGVLVDGVEQSGADAKEQRAAE
jgi:hypothetical protein